MRKFFNFILKGVLLVLFFTVMTPIGLILRILRIDFMQRKLNKNVPTYWIQREQAVKKGVVS